MSKDAVISQCGRYRFSLRRGWFGALPEKEGPTVLWVMLNPSTADASLDDATIRRVAGFSARWGFTALEVVNLFAFRSRHPADLLGHMPHPQEDWHLAAAIRPADRLICAWGTGGAAGMLVPPRAQRVLEIFRAARSELVPECLGTTKQGQPLHPLYRPNSVMPEPFRPVWSAL